MEKLYPIAQQFAYPHNVYQIQPYGAGNVNDTYLVTIAHADGLPGSRFVLQRVNTHVFRQPELILLNMQTFLGHMAHEWAQESTQSASQVISQVVSRWEMPRIIATKSGQDCYIDDAGAFWRAITLIEQAKTYPKIRDAAHAHESGMALGRFHRLLSNLNPATLYDTLPGFHITPQYLAHYDEVLQGETAQLRVHGRHSDGQMRAEKAEVVRCLEFVAERRAWVSILEDAQARGELALRAIHGDPKVDNILIDDQSGKAVSIIDLDTVKPGLVHYDIGDCLRSCCNPAGEETTELAAVTFDTDLCRVILSGYLQEAAHFFTDADYTYLYPAVRLIAFELGLRFFTDYLAGDTYFKVKHSTHNLQRALVQFRLTESIESNEGAIQQIIADQMG